MSVVSIGRIAPVPSSRVEVTLPAPAAATVAEAPTVVETVVDPIDDLFRQSHNLNAVLLMTLLLGIIAALVWFLH